MSLACSDYVRFHDAIEEGDYYRALGVSAEAGRLEIDSAAARLERKIPLVAMTMEEGCEGKAKRDLWHATCKQCGISKVVACRRKVDDHPYVLEKDENSGYRYELVDGYFDASQLSIRRIERKAAQDPSDAKLQMLAQAAAAFHYLELADLYEIADLFSSAFGEDARPPEYRQKAIEILEPLVANHPNKPDYRQLLTRSQSSASKPAEGF